MHSQRFKNRRTSPLSIFYMTWYLISVTLNIILYRYLRFYQPFKADSKTDFSTITTQTLNNGRRSIVLRLGCFAETGDVASACFSKSWRSMAWWRFFGLSTIESLRNGTPMTLCVKLKEIQRTRDWKNDGIFGGIFLMADINQDLAYKIKHKQVEYGLW